jgi:two-component system LytT family sensor kinase
MPDHFERHVSIPRRQSATIRDERDALGRRMQQASIVDVHDSVGGVSVARAVDHKSVPRTWTLGRWRGDIWPWCVGVWRWSFPIGTCLGLASGFHDYAVARAFGQEMSLAYWAVGEVLLFWFWSLFTPWILLMMRSFPLRRKSWLKGGLIHLAAYAVLAVAYTGYYLFIDGRLGPNNDPGLKSDFVHSFSVALSGGIVKYYLPILVAGYIGVYYTQLREKEVHNAQLASQLGQAQLRALKAQLQPHFLFNTLHSISTLVYTDARSADEMISQLSDLLRMTLEAEEFERVPLRQEMDYVRKYLAIEQTRFSDRLQVDLEVDPATLDFPVPYFLLQPIVENCVRHGISKKARGGSIHLRTSLNGERLRISISDDGPGTRVGEADGNGRSGVGLKNTRERLEQFYGRNFEFTIQGSSRGTQVEFLLPFAAVRETV